MASDFQAARALYTGRRLGRTPRYRSERQHLALEKGLLVVDQTERFFRRQLTRRSTCRDINTSKPMCSEWPNWSVPA